MCCHCACNFFMHCIHPFYLRIFLHDIYFILYFVLAIHSKNICLLSTYVNCPFVQVSQDSLVVSPQMVVYLV